MLDPTQALENREQPLPPEQREALTERTRAALALLDLPNDTERPTELNQQTGASGLAIHRRSRPEGVLRSWTYSRR